MIDNTIRKKIKNVFVVTDYNCIACSPHNPIGLKLQFFEEGEHIVADWFPKLILKDIPELFMVVFKPFLLDEISAWTIYIKAKTAGVTSRLSVKYKKEVVNPQTKITVKGTLVEVKRNLGFVKSTLLNEKGEVCAEAESTFFFPLIKQ